MYSLQQAVLQVLEALSLQVDGWGINMMYSCSDFHSFLMNRFTMNSKEQMELKYNIIVNISKSIRFLHMNDIITKQINQYIEQGIFAKPRGAELAELLTI